MSFPDPSSTPPDDLVPIGGRGAYNESVPELLAEYVRTRRPETRERLIVLHLDLVSRLARQLAGRGAVLDDLIQVGYIGLMKAIDRFDPERKVAFVAYAIPTIGGEMRRYLRDHEPIIHVPRQVQEQRLSVLKATERLAQQLGRPPTDAEIAAMLGLERSRLDDIRASERAQPVSLDRRLRDAEDDSSSVLGDHVPGANDALDRSEDRVLLERAIGYLSPRQWEILNLVYYEGLSQAEIGEQLGISQMQVSRLCRAALERLREGLAEGTGRATHEQY